MVGLKKNKQGNGVHDLKVKPEIGVDELFNFIITNIKRRLSCPRTAIMVEDFESGEFTVAAYFGISPDFACSCHKKPNWTLGKVLWEEMATIFNCEAPNCKEYNDLLLETDFVSVICAPIRCENVTIGYIQCEHDIRCFDEQALRFVCEMAKLCFDNDNLRQWVLAAKHETGCLGV